MTDTPVPILVYGPRKSGTTLLQSLLDGHPEIAFFPGEYKIRAFKTFLFSNEPKASYLKVARSVYTEKIKGQISGEEDTQDIKILNEHFDFNAFCNSLQERTKDDTPLQEFILHEGRLFVQNVNPRARYIGSKEVGGNTDLIIYLHKVLHPASKVILITRSPEYVVRSIVLDRRRRGSKLTIREIIREYYEAHSINKFILKIQNWATSDCKVVRYEKLVSDTRGTMEEIASFLSISFAEELLRPSILGTSVVVKTSSRDEAAVFSNDLKSWRQGLALRETLAIGIMRNILRFK